MARLFCNPQLLWLIRALLWKRYESEKRSFIRQITSTLAPPLYILYRIARSLFPLNDGDIQIALAKAQHIEKKQPGKPPQKTNVRLLSSTTDKTPDC